MIRMKNACMYEDTPNPIMMGEEGILVSILKNLPSPEFDGETLTEGCFCSGSTLTSPHVAFYGEISKNLFVLPCRP